MVIRQDGFERPSNSSRRRHRRGLLHQRGKMIGLAVALSVLWPYLMVQHFGSVSALLLASNDSVAAPIIRQDFPNLKTFPPPGHDGQQFYVIARNPFNPHEASNYLNMPARRYRRIVYPLAAWAIAPGKGDPLVLALALVSIIGVGIGAWSLTSFPRAPAWLALMMALTPPLIVSQFFSLSDVLATGLIMALFAAAFRRRWDLTIVLAILACLTRETAILAVVSLVFWPQVNWKRKAFVIAMPTLVLGAWFVTTSRMFQNGASGTDPGEFSAPFVGWLHGVDVADILVPLALLAPVVWAAAKRTTFRPIQAFLVLNVILALCLGPVINFSWVNSTRAFAPAIPLAIWALVAKGSSPVEATPVDRPIANRS